MMDNGGPILQNNDQFQTFDREGSEMSDPTVPLQDLAQRARAEQRHPLDAIFAPRAVAVIGATEKAGSVGRSILWNLIQSPFGGTVYPVNPKRPNVLGIRSYPKIAAIPEPVDLAVVVTPAPTVPQVIAECVEAGVKGAIIISAGFKEIGPEGADLERQVLEQARRGRMRLIGPNCLGVMCLDGGLNATFAAQMARPGSVGFLSQSGALCTAILDWSLRVHVGFSTFVSIGSMLDVGWGDLIDYLGDDPHTKCIVIYMESIGDARSFLSASREVALTKPIIVIKAGRTEAAAKEAASHTGSLSGSDDALDAAFRRVGVLRVDSISQVFDMAEVLAKQPRPRGPRLAIVTNAGGPGVLAIDSLIEHRGKLAELSDATLGALNGFLPAAWSHGNPIDILGDADAERYARTIEVTLQDPNIDGLLAILTPQAMSDPTATARALSQYASATGKPVLASWMGGELVEPGERILDQAGIATFAYPDTAAQTFTAMWRSVGMHAGHEHFQGVTVQPMVKVDGYELIIGSSLDPQLGPVLLFGTGGQLVEVFQDRSLALPPLNTTLARRMMEQTRILTALKGVRGRRPVDLTALEQLLVRFSDLVVEQTWIKEIDINPLLASPDRLLALDARVIVNGPDVQDAEIPRPAIRPYPTTYVSSWTAKDGSQFVLRPIRPEDEPLIVKFHRTLSDRSVVLRYFHAMTFGSRVAHERLTRICFIDYDREMALVTEHQDPETDTREIIGVGRLSKVRGTNEAEFALIVSDPFQGKGVGTALLERLIQIGRDEKIDRIVGDVLPENTGMQRICQKLGFQLVFNAGDPVIKAMIDL
jgi:acetyl coenzyme A synthetase (ADP forming)-like protein